MADIQEFSEREEIEMLLPWYAMGTLDAADAARVADYIGRHPDMAAQLRLIEAERQASVVLNEAITIPPGLTPDKLLAQTTPRLSTRARAGAGGVLSALAGLFQPGGNAGMRWVAAAAVAVMVAQAVTIGMMLQKNGSGYELASGAQGTDAAGTLVIARLKPDARVGDLVDVLRTSGITVVDGPGKTGMLTLRIGPEGMSKDQIDAAVARLKGDGGPASFVTIKGR